jgi:GWxTD domain-containing protein
LGAVLCSTAPTLANGQPQSASVELLNWAEGPVRWLLLPSDWREVKRIEDSAEAVNFIEGFWRLRDSDPTTEENEFHAQFAARVEAADLLYGEHGTRGSLTDRGRALILLGPPPHMKLGSEEELAWKSGRRAKQRSTTRRFQVEVWRYPEEELPAKLVGVLRAADLEPSVELKFRVGRRGAMLAEGENSLILVSRLALVQD